MTAWRATTDLPDLLAAIEEFERLLPGWWYSLGTCSVSRDASCGPDRTGPDADLLEQKLFDDGFHHDDREGSMADSLRIVMEAALKARKSFRDSVAGPR